MPGDVGWKNLLQFGFFTPTKFFGRKKRSLEAQRFFSEREEEQEGRFSSRLMQDRDECLSKCGCETGKWGVDD